MSWIIAGDEKNGLLDIYPGAAAAYSLRNLQGRSGKDSAVVRVRRDNDDAEQDFTAAEVSDGTLAAWVGAGNDGFVRTWYDQSGNGNDAEQATTSTQPRIVLSGVLEQSQGRPAMLIGGSYLELAIPNLSSSNYFDIWHTCEPVLASQADTSTWGFFSASLEDSTSRYVFGSWATSNTGGETLGNYFSGNQRINSSIYSRNANTPTLVNIQCYQSGFKEYINGSEVAMNLLNGLTLTSDVSPNAILNTNTAVLGGAPTGPNSLAQEYIIYLSNQSANRAAIEANINAHYSIF